MQILSKMEAIPKCGIIKKSPSFLLICEKPNLFVYKPA